MGALVFLTLLGAIPACGVAAALWAGVARGRSAEDKAARLALAARWTAVALALQGISLLATALVAVLG